MITMVVGEIANFAADAFAPAILVTPLGALSIIIRQKEEINLKLFLFTIIIAMLIFNFSCSAALAHIMLREKLHIFGILGCVLCIVGSVTIVLHAPQEREIESVKEVWDLATEPGFLIYATLVTAAVFIIIIHFIPQYGQTHVIAYIGVCSLVGSLSAIDTFNTAVVSPIYYVMFTTLTIVASVIMFKDWAGQNPTQIATELCGFVTILSGTFLLHKTKDMNDGSSASTPLRLHKHTVEDGFEPEGIPLWCQESTRSS